MDRAKAEAWRAREAARHAACATRPEDWVDADGIHHNPPRYEVMIDTCPGCAEIGRMQAQYASQLPKDELARMAASAGVLFRVVPFDPRREVTDMADMMPTTASPEPSLADPVMRDGRVLTPDG